MKYTLSAIAILVVLSSLTSVPTGQQRHLWLLAAQDTQHEENPLLLDKPRAKGREENPCSPPNRLSLSLEETVWRLWIAATCPVNNDQYPYVTWENWIEQAQMFPQNPGKGLKIPASLAAADNPPHLLHASLLALAKNPSLGARVPGQLGGPDQDCNAAQAPPPNQKGLIICEEVRLNGSTQDYITGTGMWRRRGQKRFVALGKDIEFPAPSVEIKADWISLPSIGYDCSALPTDLTQSVHIEVINGNCFALAGMHLISKLVGQWIWATFEPQNRLTNPFRCIALGCTDGFGSNPARTHGVFSALSAQLADLMRQANLAPEWKNYRLDSVQSEFVSRNSEPTLSGNSIIEGENAGIPLGESSCITCHALSSIKSTGTDGITLLNSNPVGRPERLPSQEWIRRDFVWSLLEACPAGAPSQPCEKQ